MNRWRLYLAVAASAAAAVCFPASVRAVDPPSGGAAAATGPVELSAEQDHRRMMELLGIASLRTPANGLDPNAPNAANYDESIATPYPCLPDPLIAKDRRRIDSAELWWKVRRPEIVEDFDREMYGRVPAETPTVTWTVESTEEVQHGAFAGTMRKLRGKVDNSAYPAITVEIEATLTLPREVQGPTPVMIQLTSGFFGGFGKPNPEFARRFPPPPGPSWRELVLARGWGCAAINTASFQEDNGAGLTRGVIGLVNKGQPRDADDWGALRAWAWGASRLLDYLETVPEVDAKRVGVEGHSRWGKAALVAMAYDQRLAAAYVSSSGEGGAKLHRRNCGEIVENIASSGEYHWMAGNIMKYAGPLSWDDLPVDAHELIALCAPRPVLISSGDVGDAWVDARGMFLATVAAGPVYELLGKKGLGTTELPAVGTGLLDGELAFRQHSGGHSDGPNWPTFLDFAARHFADDGPER